MAPKMNATLQPCVVVVPCHSMSCGITILVYGLCFGGCLCVHDFIFKDVSREFDEFQVNTHLCKLRCWYS